jgi:hypothetical protein
MVTGRRLSALDLAGRVRRRGKAPPADAEGRWRGARGGEAGHVHAFFPSFAGLAFRQRAARCGTVAAGRPAGLALAPESLMHVPFSSTVRASPVYVISAWRQPFHHRSGCVHAGSTCFLDEVHM